MPELPDLQVFSRNLDQQLAGRQLQSMEFGNKRILPAERKSLQAHLLSQKIKSVYREGKELRILFSNKALLGMHLMLRGQLVWLSAAEQQPVKYAIITLHFDKGPGLVLTDPRNMAKITLNPPVVTVPDALSAELTQAYFADIVKVSRATIKSILTDQHLIRGIGNAYADEILWKARIAPQSPGQKIPLQPVQVLFRAIHTVLETAAEQIYKKHPALIGGEVRDLMKIHQPGKKTSPTGAPIQVQTKSGSKTYFTDEQVLYA